MKGFFGTKKTPVEKLKEKFNQINEISCEEATNLEDLIKSKKPKNCSSEKSTNQTEEFGFGSGNGPSSPMPSSATSPVNGNGPSSPMPPPPPPMPPATTGVLPPPPLPPATYSQSSTQGQGINLSGLETVKLKPVNKPNRSRINPNAPEPATLMGELQTVLQQRQKPANSSGNQGTGTPGPVQEGTKSQTQKPRIALKPPKGPSTRPQVPTTKKPPVPLPKSAKPKPRQQVPTNQHANFGFTMANIADATAGNPNPNPNPTNASQAGGSRKVRRSGKSGRRTRKQKGQKRNKTRNGRKHRRNNSRKMK